MPTTRNRTGQHWARLRSELFVTEWQRTWARGGSLDEVAGTMGMSPRSCSNLAAFYRKKKIPLERFRRGTRTTGGRTFRLDVVRLTEIAAIALLKVRDQC